MGQRLVTHQRLFTKVHQVKVTFITADMGSDCMSNTLKVFDTSTSRQLSGNGLEAKCGKNPFPAAYDPIVSDGPLTIK